MKKPGLNVIIKYALLQLPGIILLMAILLLVQRWYHLHPWVTWGIIIGWVSKDIIMFPFVWRFYDGQQTESMISMVGERGIAKERLDFTGYIKIRGELWKGRVLEGSPPINKGQRVRVCEVRGLTLIVEADND